MSFADDAIACACPHRPAQPSRRTALQALAPIGLATALLGQRARAQTPFPARIDGSASEPFAFGLLGDTPYFPGDEERLLAILRRLERHAAFAIHVGDLKGSHERCDDELFAQRRALLAGARLPVVSVPGDNEWYDCNRPGAGGFDPGERLQALRRLLHPGSPPLDQGRLAIERGDAGPLQGLPEYQRWVHRGTLFVTLNLPGGWDMNERVLDESVLLRRLEAANRWWLRDSFAAAARARIAAVVIAAHANPRFERDRDIGRHPGRAVPDDGYARLRRTLAELCGMHSGEVLLLHGDTHRFRVDRPLRDSRGEVVPNLQRVECFGWPFTAQWVEIAVTPGARETFFVATRQLDSPAGR